MELVSRRAAGGCAAGCLLVLMLLWPQTGPAQWHRSHTPAASSASPTDGAGAGVLAAAAAASARLSPLVLQCRWGGAKVDVPTSAAGPGPCVAAERAEYD